MPPSNDDDVRAELERFGERRQAALAELDDAAGQLRAAIKRAAANDVGVTEIARLAQISRQAVWDILRSA